MLLVLICGAWKDGLTIRLFNNHSRSRARQPADRYNNARSHSYATGRDDDAPRVESAWGFDGEVTFATRRSGCNVFFVWEILRPLLRGATVVTVPDETSYDPHGRT